MSLHYVISGLRPLDPGGLPAVSNGCYATALKSWIKTHDWSLWCGLLQEGDTGLCNNVTEDIHEVVTENHQENRQTLIKQTLAELF